MLHFIAILWKLVQTINQKLESLKLEMESVSSKKGFTIPFEKNAGPNEAILHLILVTFYCQYNR